MSIDRTALTHSHKCRHQLWWYNNIHRHYSYHYFHILANNTGSAKQNNTSKTMPTKNLTLQS